MSEVKWSGQLNKRRCELIDKEIDGTLTDKAEIIELDELTKRFLEYLDRVAPLQIENAEKLYQKLRKKANL